MRMTGDNYYEAKSTNNKLIILENMLFEYFNKITLKEYNTNLNTILKLDLKREKSGFLSLNLVYMNSYLFMTKNIEDIELELNFCFYIDNNGDFKYKFNILNIPYDKSFNHKLEYVEFINNIVEVEVIEKYLEIWDTFKDGNIKFN